MDDLRQKCEEKVNLGRIKDIKEVARDRKLVNSVCLGRHIIKHTPGTGAPFVGTSMLVRAVPHARVKVKIDRPGRVYALTTRFIMDGPRAGGRGVNACAIGVRADVVRLSDVSSTDHTAVHSSTSSRDPYRDSLEAGLTMDCSTDCWKSAVMDSVD